MALNAILRGLHQLIISEFILGATARVLRYPRLLARHGLSEQEIEEHIDFLRRISELVDVVIGEPVVLSDPDDEPVIYTALDGRADVLCTLDRHFFQPHVIKFCRARNIAVMTRRGFSPAPCAKVAKTPFMAFAPRFLFTVAARLPD